MVVSLEILPFDAPLFNLFISFFTAYIIYSTIFRLYSSHLRKQLAAQLGCQPAKNTTPRVIDAIKNSYACIMSLRQHTYNSYMQIKFTGTGLKTVQQTVFGHISISTCDPENIKAVLSTNFENFILGRRNEHMTPLLGHGIFSTDGEIWKYARTALRPHFAKKELEDFRAIERHFQKLLAQLDAKEGGIVEDFQALFFKFTLDSSTEFLTGSSPNTLADIPVNGVEKKNKFMEAFDKAQEQIVISMVTDLNAIIFKLPAFKNAAKTVFEFVDSKIAQALEEIPEGASAEPETRAGVKPREFTILHHLISDTRDPVFLRDQILNLLLAGRDTSACLLSFTVFELARHPEVYKKLRTEIFSQLGPDETKFTFSSLKDCSYLQHVLNEVLRLYPPVPDNMRYAKVDTCIPRGGGPDENSPVFIAKGNGVNFNVFSMHRDESIWGPTAEKFIPERWERGAEEYRKVGAWDYLPFNGGPRICIGQQYALANAGYVIARLCQTFERIESLDEERKDPVVGTSLVMYLVKSVPIRMVKA